ncbi:hypothetical protein ETAE_2488 [Edwardsiella piscicida]|uniref:Uncharacterized protein n=1 Tax=Edwardsiella piscicida TaxID=1263550 RepID=A0AAU8P4H5_EDWPI|nr:hypothetical protein ETAE_2488 [Edwardsiella tarda EIB202]
MENMTFHTPIYINYWREESRIVGAGSGSAPQLKRGKG